MDLLDLLVLELLRRLDAAAFIAWMKPGQAERRHGLRASYGDLIRRPGSRVLAE
jgi:hypothetical protein